MFLSIGLLIALAIKRKESPLNMYLLLAFVSIYHANKTIALHEGHSTVIGSIGIITYILLRVLLSLCKFNYPQYFNYEFCIFRHLLNPILLEQLVSIGYIKSLKFFDSHL